LFKADDAGIAHQLEKERQNLCRLISNWQTQVRVVPCEWPTDKSWGPSDQDIQNAQVDKVVGRCRFGTTKNGHESDSQIDSLDDWSMADDADAEFVDAIEDLGLTIIYQEHRITGSHDIEMFLPDMDSPGSIRSRKRNYATYST
jgi:hypothetical protein